eukprot:Plantae.Rhodophyta-Hildenbrandia_rubra.ctg238.p1 GENE.Plantae.Rhodophyta-Hildenbrandia_rubra.ctg238~~Plantae.Rhodophyta-Hildenbrandia_rubra.ctg238.p1  ORF type:complete len:137 (-),score=1.72 Plantae.Rhodophyta-Hildenbrandia_rubra.ctg238:1754-2164(-)
MANNNKKAVIKTAHTKSGIRNMLSPGFLMFKIVVIKFIAPKTEDAPAKCKLNIVRSTAAPEWLWIELKGGYNVQPVPAPISTKAETKSKHKEGGSNQKLMLLSRGKAISGLPIIIGTSQFPKPPIITGMTMKKIIK